MNGCEQLQQRRRRSADKRHRQRLRSGGPRRWLGVRCARLYATEVSPLQDDDANLASIAI